MGNNFAVSLAVESDIGKKVHFDLIVSSDDSIMNNICGSIRTKMWVGILCHFLPASCPSRMADSDMSFRYSLSDFTHKSIYAV